MTANKTPARVSKKTFSREDAETILEHISNRSFVVSGEKMPAFIHGYIMSMLTSLANRSPAAAKELLADVEYVKSL